jgi:ATP-binding cassette subfamily F protein 3
MIEKIKERMEEEVFEEPNYVFKFPTPPMLNRPILRITDGRVGYHKDTPVMKKVNIEIDMETRIAFVGPNGAGKSTLLKTLIGKIDMLDGDRIINGKVKVGVFTQHHMDLLDPRLSALEFFHVKFP